MNVSFNSPVRVSCSWSELKDVLSSKSLRFQYAEDFDRYDVFAVDGPAVYVCTLWKPDAAVAGIPSSNEAGLTEFETVYKSKGNTQLAVATSDGKPIYQPSMFPGGVYLYITGAGDDGARGNGQQFAVQSEAAGDETIEFSFKDWVYLSSGGLMWSGAEFGDYVSFEFYCPASTVVPNGSGTGNCNLVDPGVGAAILIVPAAGNGAYDVDLASANPIPAYGPNDTSIGYWNWSEPSTGKGTVTPSSTPGAAPWHLFAALIPLVRFANRVPLLGSGSMDMNPPAIKSKKMLPHWKGKVLLHNSGHAGLKAAWWLATARTQTL